jgi:hypothetical protein
MEWQERQNPVVLKYLSPPTTPEGYDQGYRCGADDDPPLLLEKC